MKLYEKFKQIKKENKKTIFELCDDYVLQPVSSSSDSALLCLIYQVDHNGGEKTIAYLKSYLKQANANQGRHKTISRYTSKLLIIHELIDYLIQKEIDAKKYNDVIEHMYKQESEDIANMCCTMEEVFSKQQRNEIDTELGKFASKDS